MFRRNEFSLTPLLSVAHGQTQGAPSWVGNNKTRFAFANVGVALNVLRVRPARSRALRSVSA